MSILSKKYPIGLDISNLSLKLVQLKKSGKKITLSSYNSIKLDEEVLDDGEILDMDKAVNGIKELFRTVKGKKTNSKEVVACLPETKTFIKLIEIDKSEVNNKKEEKTILDEIIRNEAQKHIPFDLKDLYYDWQIIKDQENVQKVLFGAVPKDIVDNYHKLINSAGLIPIAFEIEPISIIHSLFMENQENPEDEAVGIIDLGASRSSFILYDHGTIQFSLSIPISGNLITSLLQDSLQISYEQAEKAKIICGLDSKLCKGALKEILFKILFQLVNKTIESINFYYDHFSNCNKVSKIIICGGMANLKNLTGFLEKNLNVKVEIANPWVNLSSVIDKKLLENEMGLRFTTAIGLSLREIKLEFNKSK